MTLAAALSACAVGEPKPTTEVFDTIATLNGNVYSSVDGPTTYWWRYGQTTAYGKETPPRTVEIADREAHPVADQLGGLDPDTSYHFQLCVQDTEEDPPRQVCSQDQTFSTNPTPTITATPAHGLADTGTVTILVEGAGYLPDQPMQLQHCGDQAGSGLCRYLADVTTDGEGAFSTTADVGYVVHDDVPHRDCNVGPEPTTTCFVHAIYSAIGPSIHYPRAAMDFQGHVYTRTSIAFTSGSLPKLDVMNPDGTGRTTLTSPGSRPDWSPDGERVTFRAVGATGTDEEIWVADADGGIRTQITDNSAVDSSPVWSPDGERIAFWSNRDGNAEIYVMDADGDNQSRLTTDAAGDFDPDWAPSGQHLAFESNRDGNAEIYVMDADGDDPTNLTDHSAVDQNAAWSPDGNRIAFDSGRDHAAGHRVWVMDRDGSDPSAVTGTDLTARWPSWSPDGKRLTFGATTPGGLGDIFVADAGGEDRQNLTNTPSVHDVYPDWAAVP